MVLLNKLLKSWFDEIFFGEREFVVFPQCIAVSELTKSISTIIYYQKSWIDGIFVKSIHIVEIMYGNFLSIIFGKNFVKLTVLLNKLLKSWFDELFFGEKKFLVFPHCTVKYSKSEIPWFPKSVLI